MPYRLPELTYGYSALEPFIDAETLRLHHAKHHAGHVEQLNRLLLGRALLNALSLEDILSDISVVPAEIRQDVRNHGGGHLNHSLFWQGICPGGSVEIPAPLGDAIEAAFGGRDSFESKFIQAAMDRFGGGWAWLAMDDKDDLVITTTPNQDSPLMLGYRPVLGADLCEHAYYLTYHDRRCEYLKRWFENVNWQRVGLLYELRLKNQAVRTG